jgi:transcriptional regulator with XRE-family HTH domain
MIGEKLKIVRKQMGISQQTLSDELDLSIDYIRSLETDRKSPSIETLVKICLFFKVSSDYLLGLPDHEAE